MDQDEYLKVEKPAIEQLKSLGWTYVEGAEFSPDNSTTERNSFKDVVLSDRLTNAVKRINPWINEENLRKVVRDLTHPQTFTLDVSVVFDDMGDGYYQFKSSLESKEMIREVLGADDQNIVNQFEKWWDKYHVSLHDLDAQVEEAEKVMKGYLKELGYE